MQKEADRQPFLPCVNWSYSKGDTYSATCIILTNKVHIMDEEFDATKLGPASRNTLYVALTRSQGNVYVVSHEQAERCRGNGVVR